MARVVRHMLGQVVHAMQVPAVLAMMVLAARLTQVREVLAMTVQVALRMMVPEDRHIQGQVVRAMRVQVAHAIQALGERAEDVHRYANDTLPILGG
jgi:hypothetical protein